MSRIAIRMPLFLLLRVAVLFLGVAALPVNAQETADPPADVPEIVVDELDRGTPMRSGSGFTAAVEIGRASCRERV